MKLNKGCNNQYFFFGLHDSRIWACLDLKKEISKKKLFGQKYCKLVKSFGKILWYCFAFVNLPIYDLARVLKRINNLLIRGEKKVLSKQANRVCNNTFFSSLEEYSLLNVCKSFFPQWIKTFAESIRWHFYFSNSKVFVAKCFYSICFSSTIFSHDNLCCHLVRMTWSHEVAEALLGCEPKLGSWVTFLRAN